ncbi:SAM-dependent methyltransferase [Alkalilimnicola ehrlichii]|uniref:SAM-dependent methyltransferase n=1 Tax=Alkalilimnicola ehrlichii TaxID=351052 RepID=A0A3E0WMY1_9GAMM|nr:class I SAM-dependent methyltransferase [Alkalilimnicola ehrlichii]RFA27037.1 SAM-dependent methyltransferase [Alkalilimnicola ehrlichii]RFA34158.1 SAM-dependent methyltransferase [Alkalilimnicola ehrlichii]
MDKQKWNPAQYAEQAHFVSELGAPVVDLLAPRPGERILDLGCGDGVLTKEMHDAGCRVVGVDASPEMVAAAISKGVDARVVDGHELQFESEFDAVFSNAALHWMTHPGLVLNGVYRALKPGGRFVGEFGGYGNVATIRRALDEALTARGIDATPFNPWFFPRAEEYRLLLERYGFEPLTVQAFARPTPLPNDVTGWLETFAQSFINGLPQEKRKRFVVEVVERCRPALCDGDGRWVADYVRLRFAATKSSRANLTLKPTGSSAGAPEPAA